MQWLAFSESEADTAFMEQQRFITEKITAIFALSPAQLGVETMIPIEETVDPESYQAHPNCLCTLSPLDESQESPESSQESPELSQEEAPPVAIHYDCSWNHDTGRVVWQRIEEPITVKPKPIEQAKHNRAGRRQLRQALWCIVHKAQRRKAKLQPQVCPRCMAPMRGLHLNRYGITPQGEPGSTVVGHDFWQCQCQPTHQPRRARYECDMCHVELWQTDEERKQTTVCEDCGEDLRQQWEADAASASEAMRRASVLREEDDEMHRAAQEAMLSHAAL